MIKAKRWVLLKHIDCPDDSLGFHFDLLLEDEFDCRSWRLEHIPELDGPELQIYPINPHNLSWLDTPGRKVSMDRGWAHPVRSGTFIGTLPIMENSSFQIQLIGQELNGILEISGKKCILK